MRLLGAPACSERSHATQLHAYNSVDLASRLVRTGDLLICMDPISLRQFAHSSRSLMQDTFRTHTAALKTIKTQADALQASASKEAAKLQSIAKVRHQVEASRDRLRAALVRARTRINDQLTQVLENTFMFFTLVMILVDNTLYIRIARYLRRLKWSQTLCVDLYLSHLCVRTLQTDLGVPAVGLHDINRGTVTHRAARSFPLYQSV
jgi:hypothetical protein